MKDHVHYERAFLNFLQMARIPHVIVNEARKSAFREVRLKSFDFIVHSSGRTRWLVDIKGRRWAARQVGRRPQWENWVTLSDLDGLTQWQEVFGADFRALLVFAYAIEDGEPPSQIVHEFEDVRYAFAGIPMDDYRASARVRSPKWGTVSVPRRTFAQFVRPIADWL